MLLRLAFAFLPLLAVLSLPGTMDSGLQAANASIVPSVDGTCGSKANYTCTGSTYGPCCSSYDFCGNTTAHCLPSHGCQAAYGQCSSGNGNNQITPTVDGQCGGYVTCAGSAWDGACCGQFGFCTYNATYCLIENGCQKGLGKCTQKSPDGTCGAHTSTSSMSALGLRSESAARALASAVLTRSTVVCLVKANSDHAWHQARMGPVHGIEDIPV
jgi:hypothetical protein